MASKADEKGEKRAVCQTCGSNTDMDAKYHDLGVCALCVQWLKDQSGHFKTGILKVGSGEINIDESDPRDLIGEPLCEGGEKFVKAFPLCPGVNCWCFECAIATTCSPDVVDDDEIHGKLAKMHADERLKAFIRAHEG